MRSVCSFSDPLNRLQNHENGDEDSEGPNLYESLTSVSAYNVWNGKYSGSGTPMIK